MRYLLCLLLSAAFCHAQTTSKVYLNSGSVLVGTIDLKEWPIQTKYGALKIPCEEVRSIQLGLHYDKGTKEDIDRAIKDLGSGIYKVRDDGTKRLILHGKWAYPLLPMTPAGSETKGRLDQVREKILESCPDARNVCLHDVIRTIEFEARGNIQLSELSISHTEIGGVKVKMSSVAKIECHVKMDLDTTLNADSKWMDTGIFSGIGEPFKAKATGQVDLWPQGPGQYVATPKGYTTAGKGGQFMAGALIGRIGDNGQAFYIGEGGMFRANGQGTLQLFIVESPWNNLSSGSYRVLITGGE